jgi:hypothetical protein
MARFRTATLWSGGIFITILFVLTLSGAIGPVYR